MLVVSAFAINAFFNFAVGLLVARFLGPEEFGRFALALSIAIFVNTATLDWVRLAATRFYTEQTRKARPEVRATLDAFFAGVTVVLAIGTIAFLLSPIRVQLTPAMVGISVAAAVSNALFDYHTALIRARFLDRVYGRLILVRNVLVLVLTAGGAWLWHSAAVALIGMCLSVGIALTSASAALRDPHVTPSIASRPLGLEFARYGLPIVLALNLYQLIALINRVVITGLYGFGQTGQFSLAYDTGSKMITTIGSALDVMLFQIAVRFDETHGATKAREQVGRNVTVVTAILLPACVGCWLVLPSFEILVVPASFRGSFEHYMQLLLPGMFAFAFAQYAINPMFLIVKRTAPLIAAALTACVADAVLVYVLPGGGDASHLAVAQSGALIAGSLTLVAFAVATRPVWPDPRDLFVIAGGTAAMTVLLLPLRNLSPGALTLVAQASLGALVMGVTALAFDLAGLRRLAVDWRRARRLA